MILSVGGVLVAGTAAAVVNSEVLSRDTAAPVTAPAPTIDAPTGSSPAPSTVIVPETTVAPTAPVTVAPTVATTAPPAVVTALPATAVATVPATTTASSPVPGSPTQRVFRLGDAATAILDTADGQLTIVTVTPHPGWTLDRAEQDDPTSVEIRLESANGEVRFEASLVRGIVVVSLRTEGDGADTADDDGTDNSGHGGGSDDDD